MAAPATSGAIRRAFKKLGQHPGTSFGPAALLSIPLAAVAVYGAVQPGLGITLIDAAAAIAMGFLVSYAATLAAGEYSEGRDPGARGLLRMTFSRGLGSYAGTRILTGLVLFAAVMVGMAPFLFASVTAGPHVFFTDNPPSQNVLILVFTLVLSAPLALALFIFVYLQVGLTPPANALDKLSPVAGLRRSREITKGHRGELFGMLLGLVCIRFALSLFLSGPATVVTAGESPLDNPPSNPFSEEFLKLLFQSRQLSLPQALVVGVSTYLTAVVVTVVSATVMAELYLALRGRMRAKSLQPPESVA